MNAFDWWVVGIVVAVIAIVGLIFWICQDNSSNW